MNIYRLPQARLDGERTRHQLTESVEDGVVGIHMVLDSGADAGVVAHGLELGVADIDLQMGW